MELSSSSYGEDGTGELDDRMLAVVSGELRCSSLGTGSAKDGTTNAISATDGEAVRRERWRRRMGVVVVKTTRPVTTV